MDIEVNDTIIHGKRILISLSWYYLYHITQHGYIIIATPTALLPLNICVIWGNGMLCDLCTVSVWIYGWMYKGVKRFDRVRVWYQWLIYERELERLESVQLDNGTTAELSVERGPRKLVVCHLLHHPYAHGHPYPIHKHYHSLSYHIIPYHTMPC